MYDSGGNGSVTTASPPSNVGRSGWVPSCRITHTETHRDTIMSQTYGGIRTHTHADTTTQPQTQGRSSTGRQRVHGGGTRRGVGGMPMFVARVTVDAPFTQCAMYVWWWGPRQPTNCAVTEWRRGEVVQCPNGHMAAPPVRVHTDPLQDTGALHGQILEERLDVAGSEVAHLHARLRAVTGGGFTHAGHPAAARLALRGCGSPRPTWCTCTPHRI